MKNHSFLKKVVCYGLSWALWLQPQLVAATELVSLERTTPYAFKGKFSYWLPVNPTSGQGLSLELSDDLRGLDGPLHLYDQDSQDHVASLEPSKTGFDLKVRKGLPLVIKQGENPFPPLRIYSSDTVTLDADHLVNLLSVQAANIILEKDMEVDQDLILIAFGQQPEQTEALQTLADVLKQAPQGTGSVTTKALYGPGSLSLGAGLFRNQHQLQLKNIFLNTSLENTPTGNLCTEERLSLEGNVYNDGVLRSKLYLSEKGEKIHHTPKARVFSGMYHQVNAQEYRHSGNVYNGFLSHIQAESLWLGDGYQFQGIHFLAKATDQFLVDPAALVTAQLYIELSNRNAVVTSGLLKVTNFLFPYERFFKWDQSAFLKAGDKETSDLSLLVRETLHKRKDLKDIRLSGIVLTSDETTVYQQGEVSTADSDILLKGHKVSHSGRGQSGFSAAASVIVQAKEAELGGMIKTSRTLVMQLEEALELSAEVFSPLTQIVASSFDLTGSITGNLKAFVEEQVYLQGRLKGEQAFLRTAKLSSAVGSAMEFDHVVLEADDAMLGGDHKGKTLSHKGERLTLGGRSAIDHVTADEEESFSLTGTHTGDKLMVKANQEIVLAEGSRAILGEAFLQAPNKQISGKVKAETLATTGQATHFTPSSRVDIGTLQAEDPQKVTLGGQYTIGQAHIRTAGLAILHAGGIGQLDAVVGAFDLNAVLRLTQPSWIEAVQSFANHGQIMVDQSLKVDLPTDHQLGSIVGTGSTHIHARDVADPEALIFGEAGVQTAEGIHLTTDQKVTIAQPHRVSHQVGLDADGITIKHNQRLGGGGNFHSRSDLDAPDVTMTGLQTVSLSADGQLDLRNAQTVADILLMRSGAQGLLSGGTFSAPQMQVYTEGLCTTDGAAFISRGLTRTGEKAYQYFDVGGYTGQGIRQQTGRSLDGSTWQLTDEITTRVIHDSDGALSFKSRGAFDLTYAQLTASPTDTILISAVDDVRTKGVDFTAARAWMISEQGNIYEDGEALTTHTHVNRSGSGGDYTYQTTSRAQQQTALANRYNLSGGKETDEAGRVLPTLLYKVGNGKSILSQAVTIHAPEGLIMRIAPNGTIRQTALTLVDTFNEHHQTWGRGYSNNFYQGSHHSREVGGQVLGRAEFIDCLRNEEVGYNRAISDYFHERAQHVTRRAAIAHQSSYQSMQLQKNGSFFSSAGSVYQHQSMTAQMAVPVFNQIGHYSEDKPFADQPATSTLEGPVMFSAKTSSLVRDQLFKAMHQSMTVISTLQSDNFSSFQPQQFSVPQFGSHPLSVLRGVNQGIGYANQVLSFIKALQSGNVVSLALQIAGQFTNFSSSFGEERMRSHEASEASPFLDYGRAHFDTVSVQGVLAGLLMDSPTGRIPLFDIRAPRFEREFTSESNQTSESVNPLLLSFSQSHNWSRQKQSAKGSQPSAAVIFGHPDIRIDQGKLDGMGLLTAPARENQDFARVTERFSSQGVEREIIYLLPVSEAAGLTIIPRPQGNRVSVGSMEVIAPWFEQSFEQESGHRHFGANFSSAMMAALSGSPVDAVAWAALSGLSGGFGKESRYEYHRGTQPLLLAANGAPITIEDLITQGNVTVGQGVIANHHVHRRAPETYIHDRKVDRLGQGAEAALGIVALYGGVKSLAANIQDVFGQKPPIYSAQQKKALNDLLAPIAEEEEKQQEAEPKESKRSSSRTMAGESDPMDADPEPSPKPKAKTKGQTEKEAHHKTNRPAPLILGDLSQAEQDRGDIQSFLQGISEEAEIPAPTSPTTGGNKGRLDKAETNYEAAKDKGFLTRFKAASELTDARQAYEDRIHLREQQLFRAKMAVDAANYVAENPYRAAGLAGAVGLGIISGGVATPFVGAALGGASGALGGLAANDFRLQTGQDYLDVGASALTGVFAPLKVLRVGYGARNVSLAAGLAGVGIGGLGYIVNSSPMMIDGALLVVPVAYGAGKSMVQKVFFKTPLIDNPLARAANRNLMPPSSGFGQSAAQASSMEQLALNFQRPANQNLVLLYDVRATGTDGSSLIVRISHGGGDDVPRGLGKAGYSQGLGSRASSIGRGKSSIQLPEHSIKREIDTPYGQAVQSKIPETLKARLTVEKGATIYRLGTVGKSQAAEAQFWSLEHPYTPGYAERHGIPVENIANADFIEAAILKSNSTFITREAPGIGKNLGGSIEVVVPPSTSIQMRWFSYIGKCS